MKKIKEGPIATAALQPAPELVDVQAIMKISPADREHLKADIMENGVRDPLKVYTDRKSGLVYVLGGFTRLQIALELGIDILPVHEYEGTPAERRALVIQDNLNRRHFTTEQKNKLLEYLLKHDPELSTRAAAAATGTDHKTAGKVKKRLVLGGEIPHLEKTRGADGKQQKAVKTPAKASSAAQNSPGRAQGKGAMVQHPAGNELPSGPVIATAIIRGRYDESDLQRIIDAAIPVLLDMTAKAHRPALIKRLKQLIKE